MDETEKRIIGNPAGWAPNGDLEHFMECPVCFKLFDMRDLDQIFAHWHGDGPEKFPNNFSA